MALNEGDAGSLSTSTQSGEVGACKAVNISLSGTWAGTVNLQRFIGGQWVAVSGASWTANGEVFVALSVRKNRARLDFTRVSGTLVYVIEADDGLGSVGAVDSGSITPGTGPASLGKAEDSTPSNGDVGVDVFSVRNDSPVSSASGTGKRALLQTDANGAEYVTITNSDASRVTFPAVPSLTGRLLSAAASTNDTLVASGQRYLYGIQGYNARGSAVYLKLYNKATQPTVGTDTPVKTIYLPSTSAFFIDFPVPYSFSLGLGYGLTTAGADNSTAALTAADVLALNLDYA